MAVTAPAPARPLDVTALGDARYRVIDHAGSGALHTVDSHGALCDCKAFKYGGGSCKHIDAVARFQEGTDSGPSLKRDVPLPDQEPEDETRDDPELVHDDDPVTAALARIGLDALRSATDGRLHDALLRLGQEAAVLDALDAGLLEFEAAKQL
ncbi:MAG: hypothetical protein ACRDGN_05170, partial [bacterium]